MFKTRKGLFLIILLAVIAGGGLRWTDIGSFQSFKKSIILSDESLVHILDGDETGGGHRHGEGKPCKSEFPVSWNDRKIFTKVQEIAANDNLS